MLDVQSVCGARELTRPRCLSVALERAGGYYFNTGGSDKIINGKLVFLTGRGLQIGFVGSILIRRCPFVAALLARKFHQAKSKSSRARSWSFRVRMSSSRMGLPRSSTSSVRL